VDPGTNRIYVVNTWGNDPNGQSLGTVTDIDGSNNTLTVNAGAYPYGVAANPATAKIYVINQCGNDLTCSSAGTVTHIDETTNNPTTVNVGVFPYFAAVDSTRNKIYVTNSCGSDLTCSSTGTVTAIDGSTGNTVPVAVGDTPEAITINTATNRIYAANSVDGTVSVIGGDTKLQFVSVTPCRLVDTRTKNGGGGPIPGGTYETFDLPQAAQQGKNCPTLDLSSAAAFSLNVTVVPQGGLGYLTIWPASQIQPNASILNSTDGRVKANAAIIPAGVAGGVSVFASNTTDVILDIDGYFAPANPSDPSATLAFYPLTPCRVADTRHNNYPQGLGPPHLSGGVPRDFPIMSSTCNIPSNALAYSFNFTVSPYPSQGSGLGYLELWPTGNKPQNPVSTLNNVLGGYVANAAILPAGTGGDITAFASNDTDLIIDIDGYFAQPTQGNPGLSLYPVSPCRVIDTRHVGNGQPFSGTLVVDVVDSVCGPSGTAQAYVFNATVVPSGSFGYLTLWPDGGQQPNVSTLNAVDGFVTSNMAIVPTTNGSIDAFASNLTQLILDISSYFAP